MTRQQENIFKAMERKVSSGVKLSNKEKMTFNKLKEEYEIQEETRMYSYQK